MTLLPCGECHHVCYCDPISEWWCDKWKVLLGYSIRPYKCRQCSVIGTEGDTREMKAMFEMMADASVEAEAEK